MPCLLLFFYLILYSGKGYLICPVKSQVSSVFEVYWLYLAVRGTKDVNY